MALLARQDLVELLDYAHQGSQGLLFYLLLHLFYLYLLFLLLLLFLGLLLYDGLLYGLLLSLLLYGLLLLLLLLSLLYGLLRHWRLHRHEVLANIIVLHNA